MLVSISTPSIQLSLLLQVHLRPAAGLPESCALSFEVYRTSISSPLILSKLHRLMILMPNVSMAKLVSNTSLIHATVTTMAAADTLFEVMSLMVRKGPLTLEAADHKVSELGNWQGGQMKKEL